jgi:hypothetical protein
MFVFHIFGATFLAESDEVHHTKIDRSIQVVKAFIFANLKISILLVSFKVFTLNELTKRAIQSFINFLYKQPNKIIFK